MDEKGWIRTLGTFRKKNDGAFTLEATLTFPIILIVTICLMLFSLVVFEKVILQQRAQMIADRLAYIWDNSHKDPGTGEFPVDLYSTSSDGDGLYWRMRDDMFLSQFFNLIFGRDDLIEIAIGADGAGGSLPIRKLSRISDDVLPSGATGTVTYKNELLGRKVTVELERPLHLPEFVTTLFNTNIVTATATASVTEPVEFIRTTDLLFFYFDMMKEHFDLLGKFKK